MSIVSRVESFERRYGAKVTYKSMHSRERVLIAGIVSLVATSGVTLYTFDLVRGERSRLVQGFSSSIQGLHKTLLQVTHENAQLSGALSAKTEEVAALGGKITEIAGTVGTLEKLSKTDPELLQKYSKVFFLNEHYVPKGLALVEAKYLGDKDKPEQIQAQVAPFLAKLLARAEADGKMLLVDSAYRSFGEQTGLKASYKVTYGSGANQFSAEQGYSEHQLATTVDFTTPALGTLAGFEKTEGYAWLIEHAHEYGFVLSYPKGNAYYVFEPWHWRFVGVSLAMKLRNEGKYFYDLDQAEIDSYLVELFDAL
jgi:LAS superfamily LD-carboxypeptidase LdcB